MEVKESKEVVLLPKGIEAKSIKCSNSNLQDNSFYNVKDHSDEEVDILECSVSDENTEASGCNDGFSSSSFSGTVSQHDDTETPFNNDQEADSMFTPHTSLPFCLRKKKLTDHWRRFIKPIMWRCKWIDLKIKQFHKQAKKYDLQVQEESFHSKQLEFANIKPEEEEIGIKAIPLLPLHAHRNRLMKRKKREPIEETSDVDSYATNHNLFSYYEYRKSFADIALNDNSRSLDKRNNKSTKDEYEETPSLELREGDAYLEQLLLKIEAAKLEANNLKNRVDKILMENPISFFPDNTLIMPGSADVFTSSEQEMPQLVIKNEDEKPEITQVKSASVSSHHGIGGDDEETSGILLPEIVVSKQRGSGKGNAKVEKKTEQTTTEEDV